VDSLTRSFTVGGGRRAHVRFTQAADGDLRVARPAAELTAARTRLLRLPWTWLHQVHGAEVVVVERPGQHEGADADAAVTDELGAALAIHTADCVPLALVGSRAVGAIHAGWRGLEAGVVEATVDQLHRLGATDLRAVVGPCIHPECYEFGSTELERVADRYGPGVWSQTSWGAPALDMPAAVNAALKQSGVEDIDIVALCTVCDQRFFSHRARGDVGRQAMLVWLEVGDSVRGEADDTSWRGGGVVGRP
jgi:YfiH family protein